MCLCLDVVRTCNLSYSSSEAVGYMGGSSTFLAGVVPAPSLDCCAESISIVVVVVVSLAFPFKAEEDDVTGDVGIFV